MLAQNIADPVPPRGHSQQLSAKRRRVLETGVMLLFCAVFAAMVISFSRNASATYDEVAHLPAGYTYLRWHDYRLNPEHPPLIKKLAALPLLWRRDWPANVDLSGKAAVPLPVTDSDGVLVWSWTMAMDLPEEEWNFGHCFLYGIRPEALRRLQATDPAINSPDVVPPTASLSRQDFYNDADGMLFWSRLPILLLGITLALLIFSWSRELFGFAGGVLSLALFCFDPNFIANSGLVTTDVGEALFMFGAVYFLWRTCRRWTAVNLVLFLLFFGAAFATKFSAALLLPMFWLAAGGWLFSRPASPVDTGKKPAANSFFVRAGRLAGLFAAALLAAYVLIWASYSFRYSAAADPPQAARAEAQILAAAGWNNPVSLNTYRKPGQLPIEAVVRRTAAVNKVLQDSPDQAASNRQVLLAMGKAPIGLAGRLILFAQQHELLPEAFLYGFAYAEMKSQFRDSFLLGKLSRTGFRSYFPVAFLLKTPLPALVLILTSLAVVLVRRPAGNRALPFLIAPAGLYFAVAAGSHLDIGHRHLLPIYPFLYVLAGGLALAWARWQRPARILTAVLVLLGIGIGSQIVFFPLNHRLGQKVASHYLAFFNELAGGPGNGYTKLVDSNLDWGQDLGSLKLWLDERNITGPICLAYFGMADPRYYGIVHYNLPGGCPFEPQQGFGVLKPGGLIAISATNLQGVYLSEAEREAWRQILEHSVLVDTVGYSIFIYQFAGGQSPPAS